MICWTGREYLHRKTDEKVFFPPLSLEDEVKGVTEGTMAVNEEGSSLSFSLLKTELSRFRASLL